MHDAQQVRASARRRRTAGTGRRCSDRCTISCSASTSTDGGAKRSSSLKCSSPTSGRRASSAARRARRARTGLGQRSPRRTATAALACCCASRALSASVLGPGGHRQPGARRGRWRVDAVLLVEHRNSGLPSSTDSEEPRNSRPSGLQREVEDVEQRAAAPRGSGRSAGCGTRSRSSRENGESFSRSCVANSTISRSSRRTR